MTHELYTKIYTLIASEVSKAKEAREEATDYLAGEYVSPHCKGAEEAIGRIKEATWRMRKMESLLKRFEKEVEEPEETEKGGER